MPPPFFFFLPSSFGAVVGWPGWSARILRDRERWGFAIGHKTIVDGHTFPEENEQVASTVGLHDLRTRNLVKTTKGFYNQTSTTESLTGSLFFSSHPVTL